jgi:hypothetical protein
MKKETFSEACKRISKQFEEADLKKIKGREVE